MVQLPPLPGTGIDRHTGHPLAGFAHVQQSLEVIFTTHFGERVLRRWFGSFVPKLFGEPMVAVDRTQALDRGRRGDRVVGAPLPCPADRLSAAGQQRREDTQRGVVRNVGWRISPARSPR